MSGPVVLLIRRPPAAAGPTTRTRRPGDRTWAELAWMIIGFYWIGLTVLVVPVRIGDRFLDSAVLGLFPVLAGARALVLRPPGADPARRGRERPGPTAAGRSLLLTWPFAWMALILLGKTLV